MEGYGLAARSKCLVASAILPVVESVPAPHKRCLAALGDLIPFLGGAWKATILERQRPEARGPLISGRESPRLPETPMPVASDHLSK